MNEAQLLWKGVQLCIGVQLLIVGMLNVFTNKRTKLILGFICIIIASYFFKTIFWKAIDNNFLFTFFFSGTLFCFYGQLLYGYILAIEQRPISKSFRWNFALAIVVAVTYGTIRTFFYDAFTTNSTFINLSLLTICLLWMSYYFHLGIKKFRESLNHKLVSKAKRKYKFFYYAINIFLINQFLSGLLIFAANSTNNTALLAIKRYYLSFFSDYLNEPLYTFLSLYLLLFSLSQSKKFKAFFISENIHLNQEIIDGKQLIEKRIQTFFYQDKIYKTKDFKIKDAADKVGVSESIFAEYIKNTYGMNFTAFINSLRVNEFKLLLQHCENKKYSLLGIAEDAGFKSKATFYRTFKSVEGITPNEYLKSL